MLQWKSKNENRIVLGLVLANVFQSVALLKLSLNNTAIGTFLFIEMGSTEIFSKWIDTGGALLVCLLSLILGVGVWRHQKQSLSTLQEKLFIVIPVYGISCWFAFLAFCLFYNGGSFGARFSLFSYSARIALPIIVLGFVYGGAKLDIWIRVVLAITFTAHGVEALMGHPQFVDYILGGFGKIFSISLKESSARFLLFWIGTLDILAALTLIFKPWKYVILWMAAWGLVTAGARILYFGWGRWPEFGIRVSHFAIPLALHYYYRIKKAKGLEASDE